MEREILLTGIGGQGIQLAAEVLALGAIRDGREAMLFGSYGGFMRGGNSDSTVVLGDGPVLAPPTIRAAWYAVGMHPEYWPGVAGRLRPGAVAVVNTDVFPDLPVVGGRSIVGVAADSVASELGTPRSATLVALGALASATGIVGIEALADSVSDALPPYRASHAAAGAGALRAGAALIGEPLGEAWAIEDAAS